MIVPPRVRLGVRVRTVETVVPDGYGGFELRKAAQLGMFGGHVEVKQHTAANPGGKGTHVVHEYQRSTGLKEEAAVRDALHESDTAQAIKHGERLAEAIRAAGGPDRLKVWHKPGKGVRLYFPGEAGYLAIGQDGSVKETDRGLRCFDASGLWGSWKTAVAKGRKAYGESLGLHLTQYADEREVRATGARLQHRAELTDKQFDDTALQNAPRARDGMVNLGGDRIKAMVPDEATAQRIVDYAVRMISAGRGKPEDVVRGWINDAAAEVQIKLKPFQALAWVAVEEVESQAMQHRKPTPDGDGVHHRAFGSFTASELAEVAMQRAIHGRPILPFEPIASPHSAADYMRKAAPAGYEPIPGSVHGGYRKKVGAGYDYWYPPSPMSKEDMAGKVPAGTDPEYHRTHVDPMGIGGFAAKHGATLISGGAHGSTLRLPHGMDRATFDDHARAHGLDPHDGTHPTNVVVRPKQGAATFTPIQRDARERADDNRIMRAEARMGLRKGADGQPITPAVLDGAGRVVEDHWTSGGYTFAFRKGARGVPVLTVTGSKLPLPYHMIVRGPSDARSRTADVVREFEAGRVPLEGVFRRDSDEAVAVRYRGPKPRAQA